MNKEGLKKIVAEKLDVSQAQAGETINTVMDVIKESLIGGDDVKLVGFGTFKLVDRAARKGRNPQTGEEIEIPARKAISFKVHKGLKEAVNE